MGNGGDNDDAGLRQDIADELADHLELSTRAKQFGGLDEADAQQEALDAFGNPKKIAQQLYLAAMKGRLMRQNIQTAALVIMAVSVIVLGVMSWSALRTGQDGMINAMAVNNQAMLDALAAMGRQESNEPISTARDMEWANVTIELVDEAGQPFDAEGYRLSILGDIINPGKEASSDHTLQEGNHHTFGPVRIGQHEVYVSTPGSGSWTRRLVTLWPGKDQHIQVHCPTPQTLRPAPTVQVDWPEDLTQTKLALMFYIDPQAKTKTGQDHWTTDGLRVVCQPGQPTRLLTDTDARGKMLLTSIHPSGEVITTTRPTEKHTYADAWPTTIASTHELAGTGVCLWRLGKDLFAWPGRLDDVPFNLTYNETTHTLTLSTDEQTWAAIREQVALLQEERYEASQDGQE